jgi:hydroxypyruvate isomerase
MFQLSVCAGTVLQNVPFLERVREIARAGFLVDLWGWDDDALGEIAADANITIGAIPGWSRGSMVHPDGVELFFEGVRRNLEVAAQIGCRNLAIATGEISAEGKIVHQIAAHPATMWITAHKCLCRLADLAEKHDVIFSFETLNTKVDHGGYPFPLVEDGLRLIEQVDSPRIRLLLDIYHAQIEEGNVTELVRQAAGRLGYVHVADVPGRHEPGTGEINYPHVAQVLREVGYAGNVGMEAFPKADDYQAMERFRTAFASVEE